jgi:hypothetical protein
VCTETLRADHIRDACEGEDFLCGITGRGMDEDYSTPAAQIPASAANAPGSSLGFWRRSGDRAAGGVS